MILGDVIFNPEVQQVLKYMGLPYWWAIGTPSTQWPPTKGADCSGWAQMVLVFWRMLKTTEPDRSALGLADICIPVTDPTLGDLCFYGGAKITHVGVYLDNGWMIGANGGHDMTQGDDPNAHVSLRPVRYRTDFVCYGRIKPEHRP